MRKKAEDITDLQPTTDDVKEMAKVIPIRIETAINEFPFYRLSKGKGPIQIAIATEGNRGKVSTQWKVSPNAEYGHPGALAYKLDTLLVNRLIDEMRPNIPEVLKLGSLHEICRELGITEGRNKEKIKNALHQNASAYITTNLLFQGNDGTEREFKFGATRYEVIFYGEKLPNGRRADAVYIVFHRSYYEMLRHARTRPLDYGYLKELPPSAQRLYELIAPQIFAALKNDNPRAKYLYSEFCQRAPITRYHEWEKVKKQLYKIHRPHIQSGYLKAIDFEETTDANGVIDWVMWYTPGRKAKAEFKRFNTKEGRALDKQRPQLVSAPQPENLYLIQDGKTLSIEQENLFASLLAHGVGEKEARLLAEEHSDRVAKQLEALPHRKGIEDIPAFLVRAIEEDYSLPPKLEAKRRQQATAKKAEAMKASREQLDREYFEYLGQEIEALPTENPKAFKIFTEDFESFWKDACGNLGEDNKEAIRVHHFGQFVKESSGLNTLSFEEWAKAK